MATGKTLSPVDPQRALLIDFDGTLADTLPGLYQVYLRFMKEQGTAGSQAEFDGLNGPPLAKVVKILKLTHGFKQTEEELLADYSQRCAESVQHASVMAGGKEFVERVFREGYHLALVTSSSKRYVDPFLKREGLDSYFKVLITSDDIVLGKPDPEPYKRAIERLGIDKKHCHAIEDSSNGIASALAAGITVIPFKSWELVSASIPERFEWMPSSEQFAIQLSQNKPRIHDSVQEKRLEEIWKATLAEKPQLFNGQLLSAVELSPNELVGEFIDYRTYLGTLHDGAFARALCLETVSISCITTYGDNVLVGRRSKDVMHYANCYELAPSGGIDSRAIENGQPDILKTVYFELEEECNIHPAQVKSVKPLGICRDYWLRVIDICMHLELDTSLPKPVMASNGEYSELRWMSRKEAHELFHSSFDVVPLSRLLLKD